MAEVPDGLGRRPRVRRRVAPTAILGEACGTTGLIGGQVMDLESEGRAIDAAALERLHRAKTGALLSACVRGGAILGGARRGGARARSRATPSAIGLAFQVVDDVLDATEDAEHLGKTAGKDEAAQKATYVSVHGLERARGMAAALLRGGARRRRPARAAGRAPRGRSRASIVDRHS